MSEFKQEIQTTNTKVLCIQEASLTQNDLFHPKINYFNLFNHYRQVKRGGGGVAVFLNKSLQVNNVTRHTTNHLETFSVKVYLKEPLKTTLDIIYIHN